MLLTEFDPSSRAVIDPEMCVHPVEGLPEAELSSPPGPFGTRAAAIIMPMPQTSST